MFHSLCNLYVYILIYERVMVSVRYDIEYFVCFKHALRGYKSTMIRIWEVINYNHTFFQNNKSDHDFHYVSFM